MRNMIVALVLLASCSAKEAPPMAGTCIDRTVPNLFSVRDETVSFRQCAWKGRTWICRLEKDADAWQCVAVDQAN